MYMEALLAQDNRNEQKSTSPTENVVLFLRPDQIKAARNTRKKSHNVIIRLASAIKRYGVVDPLHVRATQDEGVVLYELVGDEDVWRAACLAEIERIPCIVERENSKNRAKDLIFAQIRKGNLHIFDQARALRLLLEEGMTQGEIARRLSISQSAVANKLRLLQFSNDEQELVLQANLSERHARAILRLKSHEDRLLMFETVKKEALTVSATEEKIVEWLDKHPLPRNEASPSSLARISSYQAEASGVLPKKFAMQSLQPLYNSIDRTLSIFRKTGRSVEVQREEGADEVKITIRIPTKA